MEERKDICEGYERDSVQQLDKLAKDKNERFPIYPLTYIQAVYDARTNERLDAILWKCNNVYLPWMGSAGDTRIQLPFWMRRKGVIITYKNLAEETITEKLTYDLCIADDFFRLDSSWTRITDALPVGGNITIGSNGNWFQDGVDTGFKAQGPKGDNGLTPMLRTVNNKLQYSYDGEVWNEISEYIAAWFRYQDNKIQISRDQKTWSDLSKPFTQDLYIKGYVATSSALPSTGVKQGDIYMVGPTYAAEDTEHKNPIYRMYVYNDSGWVDNGVFQSIAAGVVQTIGNSETEVMSQKAVSSIVGLDTYPVFSDTKPYVKGEIVNYGGLLYEFTADHEAGAWIGTDARETSLRGDIDNAINDIGYYISNNEFVRIFTDAIGNVLFVIKRNGDIDWAKGIPTPIANKLESLREYVDESTTILGEFKNIDYEYIRVYTDDDGKILWWIKKDGSIDWAKGVPLPIKEEIDKLTTYKDDIEGIMIEITEDGDGKILSYRDNKGVLHECVGVETKFISSDFLYLSKEGLTEFEKALKNNGFSGGQGDWSDSSKLQIDEPNCAYINITSGDGTLASWPISKKDDKRYWMQFYDMQGNYFKKRIILNAQGNSSMAFVKKNGSIDICNDEWIGDDTFSLKIGDWVPQDSFHLKAFYTDFFRGSSIVAYKVADQIEKSNGVFYDRPWKCMIDFSKVESDQTSNLQIDDLTLQLNNEAKCHPDGFPAIVFLDGYFYGIYAFCLKKHRDNYNMQKDVSEHIHLDGTIDETTIFGGSIKWTEFEIRNPKNLYYKIPHGGTYKYDADIAQDEIAGEDEVNAWIAVGKLPDGTVITDKIKKQLLTTSNVKSHIINLSKRIGDINSASTYDDKKNIFDLYFDSKNLADYELVQLTVGDTDAFKKNWQWITYDGIKWWVCEYDKDSSFGGHFTGMLTQSVPLQGGWVGDTKKTPMGWVIEFYKKEIANRWVALLNEGIISADNIISIFNYWTQRIGTENFTKEYEKWPDSPCNRDALLNTEFWKRTNEYYSSVSNNDYDPLINYNVGDSCYYGFDYSFKFVCIKPTKGNAPLTGSYSVYPKTLGYKDSFWRLVKYINDRINVENEFINNLNI